MARPHYSKTSRYALLAMAPVAAAEYEAKDRLPEVVVTAQKIAESSNDVGMSITAADADQLRNRGLTEVEDLIRLVPGFTIQRSNYNSTSFTLRDVGFFNSDLATTSSTGPTSLPTPTRSHDSWGSQPPSVRVFPPASEHTLRFAKREPRCPG